LKKPRKSKPVGVLTKTFRIIETIQASPVPLTLKDISETTGINKSTALRFLTHLENERYVTRDSRAGYSVGARLLQLGVRSTFHVNLLDAARAPLRELWRVTQETVNLGVLDTIEVVYLDCIESPQSFRLVASPGTRAVVYRTALGKAILAHLPQEQVEAALAALTFQAFTSRTVSSVAALRDELARVAEQGYAIDDEESVLGVRCFAAPILNQQREPLAAISVSGPTARMTDETAPQIVAAIRAAAQDVADRLQPAAPSCQTSASS
jgi:IclR family acetate operon transcriptional repressor